MRLIVGAITLLFLSTASISLAVESYKIDWYCIDSGGGVVSGGDYDINSSIGQASAGLVSNTDTLHWIGFWAGEAPTPIVVGTLGDAKKYADGTLLSVIGRTATSGSDHFNGFFYLEETDRSSGIRVSTLSWPVSDLVTGSLVNVIGTLDTNASGERQIVAPIVLVRGTTDPIMPLGMINCTVGGGNLGTPPVGQHGIQNGAGLNNIGLLVRVWGQVVETGTGYVLIDDGSGIRLKVDTEKLPSTPKLYDYVIATGISSLSSGFSPFILPREQSDLQILVR